MPQITAPRNIPRTETDIFKIKYFGGIDLTNQPANVDPKRSCNGINMIRDVPGKVRKRTGYFIYRRYSDRINGIFEYRDSMIVHAGEKLYLDGEEPELLYEGIADTKSDAKQLNGKLWILDGKALLFYDGTEVKKAEDEAFIPTVTISASPKGGGVTYEPVNMLSEFRRDSFLGTAGTTIYQLSFETLSSATVTVKKMDTNGNWIDLTEGTGFTVNRATGQVTFTTAPGASPVVGEDNVVITYGVLNQSYKDRINHCTFGICYGILGGSDRLFMSGNPDFYNYDWYSQQNDATYFGDLWYGFIGQAHSPIVGYSIINKNLATHKRNDDNERNIYLRYGNLIQESYLFGDNNLYEGADTPLSMAMNVQFRIVDVIQGAGAIAKYSFGSTREPMFLTSQGICSATPFEWGSERRIQNRSIYVNGALTVEPLLENAHACIHNELYMLAVNGKVYILDTQEFSYEKSEISTHQYEAYLWDNIFARVIESIHKSLYFGTDTGEIMRFFENTEDIVSYMDNAEIGEYGSGDPIEARWDFDFSGDRFWKNKRIRYIAVRLAPSIATSIKIYTRVKGAWSSIIEGGGEARYFAFSKLVFSKFSFTGDTNPRTIGKKIKIKKIDAVRFSLRNNEPLEPFGIYEIALEFSEGGNYKG